MNMKKVFDELDYIPEFQSRIKDKSVFKTEDMKVLQINVGRLCNLACKHCHVEAGPGRKEVMNRDVMKACLEVYNNWGFETIDITGGAPEMNPDFRWFVEECVKVCSHVIVRSNLVIMLESGFEDMPEFYAKNKIELFVSLPHYKAKKTNKVRGEGVYERSIEVIKRLNSLGYGTDPELILNMVYNPSGAFFPPNQEMMENEYKKRLYDEFGIQFNNLFCITNSPIGRFGLFLKASDNLGGYMNKLYEAFNPATLCNMMCRFQLSVGWDGRLYDCDFNQAEDIEISTQETVFDIVDKEYKARDIIFDKHCYACTAGAGSSCGGTTE
ncbi:arsenosugar biosynthesis radical SAM (seleno)protein ArsS [Mogibacterium sp.]